MSFVKPMVWLLGALLPQAAWAQPIGDDASAAVPAPECFRIGPGGGCCVRDDFAFGLPCPDGFASLTECADVRGFCPNDPPQDGGQLLDAAAQLDGAPQDAVVQLDAVPSQDAVAQLDAAPPADAAADRDARVERDAGAADATDGRGPDDAGARPSTLEITDGSSCGCATSEPAAMTLPLLFAALLAGARRGRRRSS